MICMFRFQFDGVDGRTNEARHLKPCVGTGRKYDYDLYKVTVKHTATLWIFEVMSDKFNADNICAWVISCTQEENK